MDDLIEEILAELPDPTPKGLQFIDLDDRVPPPVRLPADKWVEILNDAKDEFEVDGAAAVFPTWRVEAEDPLDVGDIEITDGMQARAGRLALDACTIDATEAQLLTTLPERRVHPEAQVSAAPNPANLVPLRDGDLNCVAQRVVEHFEGALRGQGLTPTRRQKIQEGEEKVHETGAAIGDVAELEKVLKRAIILRDIAGEDIYNSGKYQFGGNGVRGKVELICHNGHAWSKDLHFPQSREVYIYEGDVWQAIREATQDEPKAVWLLGGQDRSLTVDQFVIQDGRTYRRQEAYERLLKVSEDLGDESLAEKAFGENHAASTMAKKKNPGSRPRPTVLMTSRRLVWSMATADPRWTTTPET
ncbi:hypothetical protein scyTo_0003474 [Scyliorhinus torazame]|uniref:Uncharacterized protein n=1 Tax=Scyliorhinus torazame TaxID=75743 RepID=A0A401PMK8_SCYTO|nr:hypothetical protein [Scyliorhinus torazame]